MNKINIQSDFKDRAGRNAVKRVDPSKGLILFDIDGTLIDATRLHGQAITALWQRYFPDKTITINNWCAVFGLGDRVEHALLCEKYGILYDHYGFTSHEAMIETLMRDYGKILTHAIIEIDNGEADSIVLPGAVAILKKLESKHVACGIVTGNICHSAVSLLTYTNLAPYFITGGFGNDTGVVTREDIINHALTRCRAKGITIPYEKIYIIGDTPRDSEAAAHVNACMKRVLIATGSFSFNTLSHRAWKPGTKPDLILTSLTQFIQHPLMAPPLTS